jgi:cyclic-di-GMP phosphodiesterase, flagellum assembly factor TipF
MRSLGLIFIAICMAVIAASAGATVYLAFGFSGAESIVVALSVLTALGLYNALSARPSGRPGNHPSDHSSHSADVANQLATVERRLTVVEGNVAAVQYRARAAIDPLAVEIGELGTLVRQLAETVATYETRIDAVTRTATSAPAPIADHEPVASPVAAAESTGVELAVPIAALMAELAAEPPAAAHAPAPEAPASPTLREVAVRETKPDTPSALTTAMSAKPATPPPEAEAAVASVVGSALKDEERLAVIRSAIDANRIDLYLQPIVTLPQRKVRYYEALSRLRGENGEVLTAADFVPLAQQAGLMAKIDTLVIFRCVQVARRLLHKNRDVGLFCNLSESVLADMTAFHELHEFLEANRAIAPSIVLEFTQSALRSAGPIEHESLSALAELGFRFSLDNLNDLRIEAHDLAARGFRYVKIPGRLILDPQGVAADIHPADLSDLLGRFGIDLVAEKIESEAVVVDLLDCEVRFGQGFLFSPPRPIRADALQGIADRGEVAAASAASIATSGQRATGLAQLARGVVGRI